MLRMALDVETVPLDDLTPFPGNPRRGDTDAIAESLTAHGQYRPVIVQRSTNHILAGNHMAQAATKLGWNQIEAVVLDVDDAAAKKIVLADNRTADLGSYDNQELLDLLQSVALDDATLTGTGYSADDLEALTHLVEPLDLDDLLDQVGEPHDEDTWRRVVIQLPPDLAASLEKALDPDPVPVIEAWLSP